MLHFRISFQKGFQSYNCFFFLFAAETSAEFAETETGHTYHTSHYSAIWCTHHGHLALHNSLGDLAGKFSVTFQSRQPGFNPINFTFSKNSNDGWENLLEMSTKSFAFKVVILSETCHVTQSLLNTNGASFLMTSHVSSALWTLCLKQTFQPKI